MNVVVIYESRTGNTASAAELIGARFRESGHTANVYPTLGVDLKALAEADIAVVGTWTDGLIIAGHRPGGAGNLSQLPMMWDKPTYSFVTYAVRPGNVLRGLKRLLESKGADVRGGLELHRGRLESDAPNFVDGVLEAFATA